MDIFNPEEESFNDLEDLEKIKVAADDDMADTCPIVSTEETY